MPQIRGTAAVPSPQRSGTQRVVLWLASVALLVFVCRLLGIPVASWLSSVWDTVTAIPVGYLLAALVLETAQTAFAALAWWSILRAGYPQAEVRFVPVLATYAVAVALNGVLPANMGTLVMLFMFVLVVTGATFAGVFAGYLVQKIFFTVAGALVYVYLFLSVPGSFDLELGGIVDSWFVVVAVLAAIVVLARVFWRSLKKLWSQARQGGAILSRPRDYVVGVVLPSAASYGAKLAVIAVFLAAYGIPVSFHTVMSVVGGNSLANVVSVTPGGVGVNQAINTISLQNVTDTKTAVAYSTGQQLVTTAWNIGLAIVLVAVAFGLSGGRAMVQASYADAKRKKQELGEERRAKRRSR